MNRTLLYALAGAIGISGLSETTPLAASEDGALAPRSLEQLRDKVRGEAMTSLLAGETEQVRHRRWHRRRYAPRRRYSIRYIHRRGRWCGNKRYYGRRCYYTPRVLRPFRQR